MHKGIGPGSTIPLPNGGFMTMVYTPNEGTRNRLLLWLAETNPAATSPEPGSLDALRIERAVPHDLAAQMLRDGVVAAPEVTPLATIEGYNPPPNCEGFHAHDAPMPPHLAERLDGQEDDEGESVPDYPPTCSTGGCGSD